MEISVGFADNRTDLAGYYEDQTAIGLAYIPRQGVELTGPVRVRYERHPWIEHFEVDGLKPAAPRREGYGTKAFSGFVKSLNTIYAAAYDDYEKYGEPCAYFEHVTRRFIEEYSDDKHLTIFKKFCGYVENLWREGTEEMYDVAMETVLPIMRQDDRIWDIFLSTITDEFKGEL